MNYITLDEELIHVSIPREEKFWRLCMLLRFLVKWYTCEECPKVQSPSLHRVHGLRMKKVEHGANAERMRAGK